MSGFKGHMLWAVILGGMAMGILLWFGLVSREPGVLIGLGALVVLGALFPDIDTDSRGQRFFFLILAGFDAALILSGQYIWAAVLGFLALFPAMGLHGGWTHTWWAMLAVPLPILISPPLLFSAELSRVFMLYAAMVFGYFTHLVLDRRF
ncbi:MAG: metal-dependent hydrolase [Desulfonatronovibrionaceae bacterium]